MILTCDVPNIYAWIDKEKEQGQLLTVEQYNDYAKSGSIVVMPFLDIDLDKRKVVGHEGRHKAAALLDAEGPSARLKVAIYLKDRGHLVYYKEPNIDDKDHPQRFKKEYLSVNDIDI